jgi:hypothetical protein
MEVSVDTWRNDLTEAKENYKKNKKAQLIKVQFETEAFVATKRFSVAEAEELVKDLSDWIRWIKEDY